MGCRSSESTYQSNCHTAPRHRHRPQSRGLPGSHTKSPKHTRARVCRWSDRLLSAREPTIGAWRCTRTGTSGRCSSATASISARREATASISCRSGRIGPTPSLLMYLHCEVSYCCNALHAVRRSCVATTVLHCVATCRRGDRTHTARRRTHRSSRSSASPPAGHAPGTHSHTDPHRSRRWRVRTVTCVSERIGGVLDQPRARISLATCSVTGSKERYL